MLAGSRIIVGASAAQVMLVGSVQRVQSLTFEPLHTLPTSLVEPMARGESVDHTTAATAYLHTSDTACHRPEGR